jgi:hypothetical protein
MLSSEDFAAGASSAEPALPLDIHQWEQGSNKGEYDGIYKSVLPRELRHHGKIHTVERGDESWRKKYGGDDGEDFNDLVLLDVENVCYRALQIADLFVFEAEVFLHASDIIDKFVDQDLKFRFCFVADFSAKMSGGPAQRELTFQTAGDEFLLTLFRLSVASVRSTTPNSLPSFEYPVEICAMSSVVLSKTPEICSTVRSAWSFMA